MGLLSYMAQSMRAQRGHLIGWVPVCLAVGIGSYVGLRAEPSLTVLLWVAGGAALLGGGGLSGGRGRGACGVGRSLGVGRF